MNEGIAVNGFHDSLQIKVKGKIIFDEGLWRALKDKPFIFLSYPYNPLTHDTNPPVVIGSFPTEHLPAIKRLIEGKLLVMRQDYFRHASPGFVCSCLLFMVVLA
jgi:hypothetical protein